jgi:hypothetical protein
MRNNNLEDSDVSTSRSIDGLPITTTHAADHRFVVRKPRHDPFTVLPSLHFGVSDAAPGSGSDGASYRGMSLLIELKTKARMAIWVRS